MLSVEVTPVSDGKQVEDPLQRMRVDVHRGDQTFSRTEPRVTWRNHCRFGPELIGANFEGFDINLHQEAVVVSKISIGVSSERITVWVTKDMAEALQGYGYEFSQTEENHGSPRYQILLEPVQLLSLGVCLSEKKYDVGLFTASIPTHQGRLLDLTHLHQKAKPEEPAPAGGAGAKGE